MSRPHRRILNVPFARNLDAGRFLESFLVAAVATVLGIRFYLEATGYPQVGGGGLHIAHMLWGGLLMLIALVLLLALVGKSVQHIAAIAGGIGFGLFIDELGKFITSNNNYLFQPTIALLYIIFMALFFWFRAMERRRTLSEDEYLINALELIKEALLHDLDEAEKRRALECLQQAAGDSPIKQALVVALTNATPLPDPRQPLPLRMAAAAHRWYLRLVARRGFERALIAIFVIYGTLDVLGLIYEIVTDPAFSLSHPNIGIADAGSALATLMTSVLIWTGVVHLRQSRLSAYRWFKRALLVSILVGQVFNFYNEQLYALVGLAVDVLILVAVDYMMAEEHRQEQELPAAAPLPA